MDYSYTSNTIKEEERVILDIVRNRDGLEIGGPSKCNNIYNNINKLDNITIFKTGEREYNIKNKKLGIEYVKDTTNLTNIKNNTYDFILVSNTLEYIANPIKAIKEWLRILKQNGFIIMIFDNISETDDNKFHLKKIIENYEKNIGEDDLSVLPSILSKSKTNETFIRECLNNYHLRKIEHFNYNEKLLSGIIEYLDLGVFYNNKSDRLVYIIR